MPKVALFVFLSSLSFGRAETESPYDLVDFECVRVGKSLQPRHKRVKKPLGRSAMPEPQQCWLAVLNSRNGVVCSHTEVSPGFKPTHRNGTTAVRPDYGFWGSSIGFEDCLRATLNSTSQAVCYWGGEDWYAKDIQGRDLSRGGPFTHLDLCLRSILGPDTPIQEPLGLEK